MLELKNIYKTYSSKNGVTHRALENVSLKFNEKGLVFILGKSGSGKSTLLNLIAGIDSFDRGDIIFDGKSFLSFKDKDYDYYRNSCVGFVFQDFYLIDNLSVYDNVSLALDLQSRKDENLVQPLLEKMEISSIRNRNINELTGGQKQRVSIARALIKNPKIILADEPTGSLDSETSDAIIKILQELSKSRLVIIVTHNKELAYEYGDRIIEIRDGFVLKDLLKKDENDTIKDKVSMVSSNLLIVPKGHEVDDENIESLNASISSKRQDYYLLIEQNKKRVMSLFPNVKEVIDDDNKQGAFKPFYYVDDKTKKNDEIVTSKLPFIKALKFSLSNLKRKKFRMTLTILLAILSVIITGCAFNFTNYSQSSAISATLKEDNGSFIKVSSSFAVSSDNYALANSDIEYLQSLGNDLAYAYNQDFTFTTSNTDIDNQLKNDRLFANRALYGMLVCDDIEKYGYGDSKFKIIYEKENITSQDYEEGIYISSVIGQVIVNYIQDYGTNANKSDVSKLEDLIGYKFKVKTPVHALFSFPIIGIYGYDDQDMYQKYATLYNSLDATLYREYEELSKSIFSRLLVKPEFMEKYKDTYHYFKTTSITSDSMNFQVASSHVYSLSKFDYTNKTAKYYYVDEKMEEKTFEENIASLKPNQVFVGRTFFNNLVKINTFDTTTFRQLAKEYNALHRILNIQNARGNNGEVYQSIKDLEIVGVIYNNVEDTTRKSVYVTDEVFDILSNNYYRINQVLLRTDKNENYVSLVNDIYDHNLMIANYFVKHYVDFVSLINKYSTVINIVTIIWLVIVALLFYSFISSSIKDNKKQIGILKALGASIKDIYKIYMLETLLIAVFATLFGVSSYYFIGLLVNKIITSAFFTFYFAIFNFNLLIAMLIVFATFAIFALSLIISLSNVKGIKPIDVINS